MERCWYSGKGMPTVVSLVSRIQHQEFEKGKFKYMELYKRVKKEEIRIKQMLK